MLIFGFYMIWTWRPSAENKLPGFTSIQNATVAPLFRAPGGLSTPQPVNSSEIIIVSPTVQITPTLVPTATPVVSVVPTEIVIDMGRFSFYDPAIGKDKPDIAQINCASWNSETQECDSKLRNGDNYQDWYLKGAACRYDLFLQAAEYKVLSPDWLKQLFPDGFKCIDTGDAVTGLFFDFLIPWRSMPFTFDQTPWGYPVALLRVK